MSLPATQQLLEIARSDNPLIALAVTSREVSWTRFQEWLLDPHRHHDVLGQQYIQAMLDSISDLGERALISPRSASDTALQQEHPLGVGSLAHSDVATIRSVQAEAVEGKKGRCDLLIKCDVGATPLTILIENKIGAKEREDQLQDYVDTQLPKLPPDGRLLPMLIELGDDPVGQSSCESAVCWRRGNVAEWLQDGAKRCEQLDIAVPRLVKDYLDIFEAWDLAADLRRKEWRLLEVIQGMPDPPPEWSLLNGRLHVDDRQFFEEALRTEPLGETLASFGFTDIRTHEKVRGQTNVLKITKPEWFLECDEVKRERVNVHFEAQEGGRVMLHIEIDPPEGGIRGRPGREQELAPLLKVKSKLLRLVKQVLDKTQDLNQTIGRENLRRADLDHPRALLAAAFKIDTDKNCEVAVFAEFMAKVIKTITPMVDRIMEEEAMSSDTPAERPKRRA